MLYIIIHINKIKINKMKAYFENYGNNCGI